MAYDGTATTAGPYPITITASNGVSPDAMQNFTLTMVGTLYVAQSGSDPGNTCGSSATPCATISNAVSQAASGDTIDVAGTIDDHVTVPSGFGTLTITQWPGQAAAVVDGAATGTPFTINSGDTVTLDQLTVENGSIVAPGGGIVNGGTLTVTDSTISNNTASTYGGGIYNYGGITVTDSTISNNTAYFGGGIYNDGGTLTVTDSTISNNTAGGSGGGIVDHGGTANIGATIVAGNTGGNCGGAATSVGYNLTDDTSGTACGFTQSSDVVNANPDLGSLADNGGTTKTLLPSNNSPAVGKIPLGTTLNGVSVCPGLDQRGVARPQPAGGTACSIGAVEVAPAVAPAITSAASTTFTAGTPGSFTVTTTGNPTPSLTETGGLPRASRSPTTVTAPPPSPTTARRARGPVSLMITASNGVMPDAIQNFGLIFRAAVPRVTSVRPASGPTGGATVVITGSALSGATAVTFGTKPAPGFHVVSDTKITARTPEGVNANTVPVRVTTPGGTSVATPAATYTYLRPVVSGLSTTSGPAAGGTTVVITGSNLSGPTAVTFSDKAATFTSVSDSEITVTSPGGVKNNTVFVRVTTPDGTSKATTASAYTYVG